MYELLKKEFSGIVEENGLVSEEVKISAGALSPEKAIGTPEHNDYPLRKSKERLMQAVFKGSYGQAFTDMFANFEGKLSEIVEMDLTNNFQRAIFISSVNAVMRHLGKVDRSVHCKNQGPADCSRELVNYIRNDFGNLKVALVGLQPRMLEALSREFEVRVTDLDEDNIGADKFGVIIGPPFNTQ
ncbi:MAG: hypothetical protein GY864_02005, partial [Desulfobacterales bacterium]|nr:hypothetical protein [Desulfobacterales bacterium]